MLRKRIKCWCSLVLAVVLLTGCAEEKASKTEQNKNSEITEQQLEKESQKSKQNVVDYSTTLPQDYEGTLSMWGWDDTYYSTITAAFCKKYPNVKFDYTPVQNGDLLQKYETAILTGGELPDIGWAIMAYRDKLFEIDMWEALDQAPYNFDVTDVFECVRPQLTNEAGDVCGIEQELAVAGLAYRKDLAKEYLGTDDPKELETMLYDWDAFIEKGKEVYQKSGGEVYMWPGIADAQQFIREQTGESWISDNVIRATDTIQHSLDVACQFRDNHIASDLEAWTPKWYDATGKGTYIFTGCATWSVAFQIEQYDPDGGGSGHWGLMSAPEGNILWGGTTLGITKTCEDKRLAWEFIRFATLSQEGAEALKTMGLLITAQNLYEENPELCSYESPWFGNQDIGAYFYQEILPNVSIRERNIDDSTIHESMNLITTSLKNDPEITSDEAMEYLKEDLKEKLPQYKVE